MNIEEIREKEPIGKNHIYFINYSDGSVCVLKKCRHRRVSENNGKLYRMWLADEDVFPEDEHSKTVESIPGDFSCDKVHLTQGATEEHLRCLA